MFKFLKPIFALLFLVCTISACKIEKSESSKNINTNKVDSLFNNTSWKNGWNVQEDETLDKAFFTKQYLNNPRLWSKAFSFLNDNDLMNLAPGNYPIDGDNLYAIVLEYKTKDLEETNFEAHKKYADIQYVIDGKEKIGVVDLSKTKEFIPYDDAKDIGFFTTEEGIYKTATKDNYFIFFPHNSHRPSIKVDDNSEVKKIVLKVQLN